MKPERLIQLAHGAGGRAMQSLIRDLFLNHFQNPHLEPLSDAAVLSPISGGRPALTTDGFVVDPPIFPGGDLGHLSICGTVNDLAVAGARPREITWALILEEGCPIDLVERCVISAAKAAREAGVSIVAGDTKVVPRGRGDRIFIVSAGLGIVPEGRDTGDHRLSTGDLLILSGPPGDHAAAIMAARHGLAPGSLVSDCAPVNGLVEALFEDKVDVHTMHDPTRGGLTAVLNEMAFRSGLALRIHESDVSINPAASTVFELLGLDFLSMASEGRILLALPSSHAERAIRCLRSHPLGRDASVIGEVLGPHQDRAPVTIKNAYGVERVLDLLSGSDLPRIC